MKTVLGTAALWACVIGAPGVASGATWEETESAAASAAAADLADWVRASGDNRGLPFAIVDKSTAEVLVFSADGELKGATAALVGSAVGDDSVPGIGDRELSDILPEERTTPAGRFMAAYGPARGGKPVLWVDYATAVSLHPVVTSNPREKRLQRLRSPTPDDNRITYGCINVAAAFYRDVVRPTFADTEGVFYVLPETRSMAEVFPGLHTPRNASAEESERRAAPTIAEPSDDRWRGRSTKAIWGR